MLMGKVFSRPERSSVYYRRVLTEMVSLGLNSIGIVSLVSVFMWPFLCSRCASTSSRPSFRAC